MFFTRGPVTARLSKNGERAWLDHLCAAERCFAWSSLLVIFRASPEPTRARSSSCSTHSPCIAKRWKISGWSPPGSARKLLSQRDATRRSVHHDTSDKISTVGPLSLRSCGRMHIVDRQYWSFHMRSDVILGTIVVTRRQSHPAQFILGGKMLKPRCGAKAGAKRAGDKVWFANCA